jgi:hypothetical protein
VKNRLKNVAASTTIATLMLLGAPALASATTETFDYTGDVQTWVVPQGVTSATFDLFGAEGGTAFDPAFGAGGLGGRTTATVPVTPGASIEIRVGGKGGNAGGYNGGGAPGAAYPGGGGGATDVRRGGSALSDRVLVAGGGGGSGACSSGVSGPSGGGAGGGLLGGDATPLTNTGCGEVANSGKGATQSAGGAPGGGAEAGTLGQGGDAQPGQGFFRGGGGGGYYGGGGGSGHSGGGGGSGFGPADTAFETGVRGGDGVASVTYTAQSFDLTVTTSGTGTGRVASSPAGIDCGSGSQTGCTASYVDGSEVTLSASAGAGSTFTGWNGGSCSGTGPCTVTINATKTVDAGFTADDPPPVITSLEVSPRSFTPDPTPIKPKNLGSTLEIGLSEKASVRFRVRRDPVRKSGNAGSTARVFTRDLGEGKSSISFSGTFRKTLKSGRYQVIALATDSAGQNSEKARAKFRVR